MAKPPILMVQGTTSDAGKSILVTAICRILARNGFSVAPFKPQNMALNSAITVDCGEIGRAQAVQAEAAFLKPSCLMNPILLKPNSDVGAQVIVHGKSIGNLNAQNYHEKKPSLLPEVLSSFQQLLSLYQTVIVEGAGSPAEINLRDGDIANMGFAEAADCPVIIIADIDRGGVFAHLVGTYELLSTSEKKRIKGFVINRFRGHIGLLESGLHWLEQRCNVPVLGVIPYIQDLYIEAEDAIDRRSFQQHKETIHIIAVAMPHSSNHTDMDALRLHPQVHFEWLRDAQQYKGADLIILPGSKHVRGDLAWLKAMGWQAVINQHLRYGGKLIGICGGFQMLGQVLHDANGIESEAGSSQGLAYLEMETYLAKEKITRNVKGYHVESGNPVEGYEIHHGISQGKALQRPVFTIADTQKADEYYFDGAISEDGQIIGTYIHGVFNEAALLSQWLDWAGLKQQQPFDYQTFRQQQFERLADVVEQAIPLSVWLELLGLTKELVQ